MKGLNDTSRHCGRDIPFIAGWQWRCVVLVSVWHWKLVYLTCVASWTCVVSWILHDVVSLVNQNLKHDKECLVNTRHDYLMTEFVVGVVVVVLVASSSTRLWCVWLWNKQVCDMLTTGRSGLAIWRVGISDGLDLRRGPLLSSTHSTVQQVHSTINLVC